MGVRRVAAWAAVVAMAAITGCGADSSDDTDTSEGTPAALAPSPQARGRIEALRERFRMTVRSDGAATGPKSKARARLDAKPSAVIGVGVATAFEPSGMEGESFRARIPPEAKRGVARTASVELPRAATGFVRLEDDTSHLSVRFALQGAKEPPIAVADGMALYTDALPAADVVHRPHAEGTEDFVVFEERPAPEELRYAVDVSRVAGLRLVSNTLEFLDDGGSPRLRVAPPYVIDVDGVRHEAKLAVEQCAYDVNPAAPWGRRVASPGAACCTVRVAWEGVAYPAVVDPAWTGTGSMVDARVWHTASVLESGRVLIAGGGIATAELYDPASGTFSATGSMAEARAWHTASVLGSGNVLVAGGYNHASNEHLASAELYDPATGTFSATGSMATARRLHTASVLGSGNVLVAGGGSDIEVATAELYDPVAGTFSSTGSMAGARVKHTACLLESGLVLVAGGNGLFGGGGWLATAELYDPVAGTFSATGSMAEAREEHTATVLRSGKVLVAGGYYYASVASAELYDPAAGTFSATGSMAKGRQSHTASVLGSGDVLVAGGLYDSGSGFGSDILLSAEFYDPAAGTFSATASMAWARRLHTAIVLGSGNVLVAGGVGTGGSALATGELYALDATEPSSSTSTSTASSSTSTASSTSTSTGASGGTPRANPGQTQGCGCHVEPSEPGGAAWLSALGCLALVTRRRRGHGRGPSRSDRSC